MPLADEDTSVVDALRQTALEDLGLKSSLQEVLDLESQHVIEAHFGLIEHTDADQSSNQSIAFEQTLGVLSFQLEEFTSGTSDF